MGTRGPFSRNIRRTHTNGYYDYLGFVHVASWYTQDRPSRHKPLAYASTTAQVQNSQNSYSFFPTGADQTTSYGIVHGSHAYGSQYASDRMQNQLYDAFRDVVYSAEAQLAATAAEYKQAHTMIARRANQLRRAYSALRRGRFSRFTAELGLDRNSLKGITRPSRRGLKDMGKLWLEYHFGWKPMVQEIESAIQILSKDPDPIFVRARAKYASTWVAPVEYASTTMTSRSGGYEFMGRASCKVVISNQNLNLANQLGLLNPVGVAWELIPFSFLVDWFVNVGDYLNSWTDFVGLTFIDPQTTLLSRSYDWYIVSARAGYTGTSTASVRGEAVRMDRVLSAPLTPKLKFAKLRGLSAQRGATAVSLLVQQLSTRSR